MAEMVQALLGKLPLQLRCYKYVLLQKAVCVRMQMYLILCVMIAKEVTECENLISL